MIEIAHNMNVKTVNIVRDRPRIEDLKSELMNLGGDFVWTEEELRKSPDFRENKLPRWLKSGIVSKIVPSIETHIS